MRYEKPTMELFWLDDDVICSSPNIVVDPDNPFPGTGEDNEDW